MLRIGIFHLLFAAAVLAPSCGAQSGPLNRRDYRVPSDAFNIVSGDFNNDGVADLAVAAESLSQVSVLLGQGGGLFSNVSINSAAGVYPSGMTAGDFDGDGNLDLVAIDLSTIYADFLLLRGNGDGTFQAPVAVPLPAGGTIAYVRAVDLNHDGKPDLIFGVTGGDFALILLGNGDATFQAPQTIRGGALFVTGDFNGDGNVDLAVGSVFSNRPLQVYLGKGDGTFQASMPGGAIGSPVAVGDINRDGTPDLILLLPDPSLHFYAALGHGDGTFTPAASIPLTLPPQEYTSFPVLADLDGDGDPDLIFMQQTGPRDDVGSRASECCAISVLRGHGNGTFSNQQDTQVGAFGSLALSTAIAVGDWNRDGVPDVAVPGGDFQHAGSVSVLLGRGNTAFRGARPHFVYGAAAATATPASLAAADFNRDGHADIAVVDEGANTVSVLEGAGTGALGSAHEFPTGGGPAAVAAVDMNGDGNPDLVTANSVSNDVGILLGTGDGSFLSVRLFAAGTAPRSMAVGDFNRDGRTDLAVANQGSNDVTILLGDGFGGIASQSTAAAGAGPVSIAAGDLNGDGIADLIVANGGDSTISLLWGNGMGGFTPGMVLNLPAPPTAVSVGDFDADGNLDIAVAVSNDANTLLGVLNQVLVARGLGNGIFGSWTATDVMAGPAALISGDFRGNLRLSLATANANANDVSVLLGRGDGTFAPVHLGADYCSVALVATDLNGDGRLDIVVANSLERRVTVLLSVAGEW